MTPPRYYSRFGHIASTRGGNLPHWSQTCATFVTFRLGDSLPAEKLAKFQAERDEWLRTHPRGRGVLSASDWSDDEVREYRELFSERLQRWLDVGHGACVLRDERIRQIVEESLWHFANKRYSLYAFVVMPNHVHVLFMPEDGWDARKIVADWKRYTAKSVNVARGLAGSMWQKESYDHLVRDVREFNDIRAYIRSNDPQIAFDAYACGGASVDAESSPRQNKDVIVSTRRGEDTASTGERGEGTASTGERGEDTASTGERGEDTASTGERGEDAASTRG